MPRTVDLKDVSSRPFSFSPAVAVPGAGAGRESSSKSKSVKSSEQNWKKKHAFKKEKIDLFRGGGGGGTDSKKSIFL